MVRSARWGEHPQEHLSFFVQLPIKEVELLGGVSDCLSRITRSGCVVADFGIGTADSKAHYWIEIRDYCTGSGALLQRLEGIGIPKATVAECREIPPGLGREAAQQRSLFA